MSSRVVALAALLIVALSGCAPKQPFKGPTLADDLRDLERDVDVLPPFPVPAGSTGSLWTDAGPGAALVRDTRAFRTNDLVTISIQESSLGSNRPAPTSTVAPRPTSAPRPRSAWRRRPRRRARSR